MASSNKVGWATICKPGGFRSRSSCAKTEGHLRTPWKDKGTSEGAGFVAGVGWVAVGDLG
eukprot:1161651-Pelagomonas_calceolata.AAC.3